MNAEPLFEQAKSAPAESQVLWNYELDRRVIKEEGSKDPLRILLATDAAREGLNFQAHCADLFHFDLPWNPGRIEQRNGRIDRKLQPASEVRCHYFVLAQCVEDRVLDVLVRKTETIKKELGSLSKVIDDDIEHRLGQGIRHRDAEQLAREIERTDLDAERKRISAEELEAARERQEDLKAQIERCRSLLAASRAWVGFEAAPFRAALSCALASAHATLATGRPATASPGPVFRRLDCTSFRWRLRRVGPIPVIAAPSQMRGRVAIVMKQVLPYRTRRSMAEIDPSATCDGPQHS
jgi:hypothetical protein